MVVLQSFPSTEGVITDHKNGNKYNSLICTFTVQTHSQQMYVRHNIYIY